MPAPDRRGAGGGGQMAAEKGKRSMFDYLRKLEKVLIHALMIMMALVLLLATIELGWIIIKDVISPPVFLLEIEELLDIFGLFMLVIIGIELLETIMKTYLKENVNHVEVVFLVAMIAIARKVIILDVKDVSGVTLVGIGAIVITLSAGYYLIRKKRDGDHPLVADKRSEAED
jgi:uncharacterized membrane protein (DUF373 family)